MAKRSDQVVAATRPWLTWRALEYTIVLRVDRTSGASRHDSPRFGLQSSKERLTSMSALCVSSRAPTPRSDQSADDLNSGPSSAAGSPHLPVSGACYDSGERRGDLAILGAPFRLSDTSPWCVMDNTPATQHVQGDGSRLRLWRCHPFPNLVASNSMNAVSTRVTSATHGSTWASGRPSDTSVAWRRTFLGVMTRMPHL